MFNSKHKLSFSLGVHSSLHNLFKAHVFLDLRMSGNRHVFGNMLICFGFGKGLKQINNEPCQIFIRYMEKSLPIPLGTSNHHNIKIA